MTFPHSGWLRINGVETRKKGVLDKDDYTNIMAVLMLQCFNCSQCCCPPSCCSDLNNANNNNKSDVQVKSTTTPDDVGDDDGDDCCGSTTTQVNDANDDGDDCCGTTTATTTTTTTNTETPSCCKVGNDKNEPTTTTKNERCCCCANSTYPLDLSAFSFDPTLARPFVIYSKINREICDMNREHSRAYEDPRMVPHYNRYHDTIASFVKRATALCDGKASRVLLLDMHGQSDLVGHILRGTKDLTTVQPMLKESGIQSINGPNSVLGYLHANGVPTFPTRVPLEVDASQTADVVPTPRGRTVLNAFQEHPKFNGGFTVQNYSSSPFGINCIQVEIGIKWRQTEENRLLFARLLRDSILNYYKTYMITNVVVV
ncbi:hypothetical protein SAMD00019534_004860 [Acytostelium subglobosum LB1]|uniref:hypothetical protein n=1 Tax=Acytostelium subglobosum LB1 TaxID=1410327 RepID=UPI000644948D|nr:hypothetical protein SAMD00019534_004860 [Acytostelium subglobosum LB1]GAM17311.1 hypothetical protein SAMD00019534_004860 [Acytostelium subglobosum LB1]|eukprot:XP_012759373.1 hypothetical protein SAMD00019534_004860 [Acytostelium subglobosum LB1]